MASTTFISTKKTVLITGASTGIGYELARLFAQDGYNLVLVAKDKNKLVEIASELEEKYKIYAKVITKDLSEKSSPAEIYNEIKNEQIKIDVLVNNEGYAAFGNFIDTDINDELNMLQVNVTALTHLTHLFAKEMAGNSGGKILNVASAAAFKPGTLMAVYYASKAYVLHFSEALSNEFRKKGIKVTTLCPAPFENNFPDSSTIKQNKKFVMKAEVAAKAWYYGMKRGKEIVIPGIQNKIIAMGYKLFPKRLITNIAKFSPDKRKD